MYYTGSHRLLARITRGVGAIFMLHHVSPPDLGAEDEAHWRQRVSPEFLEEAILAVQHAGFDIVSLDELHWRLTEGAFDRPFAAFTFDDGYRDNLQHAYPIFRKHELPFTIYVPGTFPDGKADLWWLALEQVIASVDRIAIKMEGTVRNFGSATADEKARTYHQITSWLRSIEETEARSVVRELCRGIGYDADELSQLVMSWDEIRQLAQDPLVTIGAHTSQHYALAKLSESQAISEIETGAERLARELGRRPVHLSFPYGSIDCAGAREFRIAGELGFKTAVTSRKGLLYAEHSDHTTALPRVSLNGDYQSTKYLSVLLSGAPLLLWNKGRRVLAA